MRHGLGSLRAPVLLAALVIATAAGPVRAAEGADPATALAEVNARCPEDYPPTVAPLPEPAGLADKDDAELVGMLKAWNPALRAAVADELAGRGDAVVPALKEATNADDWRLRAGAAKVLFEVVNRQLRHWKDQFPEITDGREAEAKIRAKYAHLAAVFLRLVRDPQRDVRESALNGIIALGPETPGAAAAILTACADEDEYLAQYAMIMMEKRFPAEAFERDELIATLKKAMYSPLPRGKGHVVRLITRMDDEAQREFIPELLYHLRWQPDRDTMFGAGGQEGALRMLTKMKVKEVVPMIPRLMDKTMRGPGLFEPCLDAVKAFGKDAAPILPELRAKAEKLEEALPNARARYKDGIRKKIEKIREAIEHVENL